MNISSSAGVLNGAQSIIGKFKLPSALDPPAPGDERRVSYLKHEFIFEKLVEL